jgi:hypothetical protein
MDEKEHEGPEKPEAAEDLEVDDLDVPESAAEDVGGGSGGDYESGTWGNIKRAV